MKTLKQVKAEMLAKALASPVGGHVILDRTGAVIAHSAEKFIHCYTDPLDLEWAVAHGYETTEEDIGDKHFVWVHSKPSERELYRSADGSYYTLDALPENDDAFVTQQYSNEIKAERNARISDTDDYVKLADLTVQKLAKSKRSPLTDDERQSVIEYRQALRDFPQVDGFPFVEFPAMPSAIAFECGQKAKAREQMKNMGGF